MRFICFPATRSVQSSRDSPPAQPFLIYFIIRKRNFWNCMYLLSFIACFCVSDVFSLSVSISEIHPCCCLHQNFIIFFFLNVEFGWLGFRRAFLVWLPKNTELRVQISSWKHYSASPRCLQFEARARWLLCSSCRLVQDPQNCIEILQVERGVFFTGSKTQGKT